MRALTDLASKHSPSVTDVRIAMELIFSEALAEVRSQGFPYFGSLSLPSDTRRALLKANLLTNEEHQFANSVYGMVSQVMHGAGAERAFVCIDTMKENLWFLAQLLITRLENRPGHERTVQPQALRPQKETVTQRAQRFIDALMQDNISNEAVRPLDMDLAAAVRDMVKPAHVPRLLSLLENRILDNGDRWLRNRIASIVLTPRTRKDRTVAERMHRIYFQDTSARFASDWPTLRGIALALASQVADDTCIDDYVRRLEDPTNAAILKEGCDASESYHLGRREFATEVFMNRLNNEQMSDEACYWEVCYLAERGAPIKERRLEWDDISNAIRRRAQRASKNSKFRTHCEDSLRKLRKRQQQLQQTIAAPMVAEPPPPHSHLRPRLVKKT